MKCNWENERTRAQERNFIDSHTLIDSLFLCLPSYSFHGTDLSATCFPFALLLACVRVCVWTERHRRVGHRGWLAECKNCQFSFRRWLASSSSSSVVVVVVVVFVVTGPQILHQNRHFATRESTKVHTPGAENKNQKSNQYRAIWNFQCGTQISIFRDRKPVFRLYSCGADSLSSTKQPTAASSGGRQLKYIYAQRINQFWINFKRKLILQNISLRSANAAGIKQDTQGQAQAVLCHLRSLLNESESKATSKRYEN